MSRIHDDRKELYNTREGVLSSPSSIRSNHTLSQSMDKEKVEKKSFVQHSFDPGFRAIDLLKPSTKAPQGRSMSASLGSTQLHAMPPLMPSYISGSGHLLNPVPINHNSLVRGSLSSGQHAFQTHIPVNIGGTATIAPPRGSVTMPQRSALPTLKPTNISNQMQLPLNQIPSLPIMPANVANRTGSPIVTSHGLPTDSRIESRTTLLSEPHHSIRGNVQAASQHATAHATIQVIASGTVGQQQHIPTSFLSKGMTIGTAPNVLKIGASSHSNVSPSASIASSAFKVGIGKAYQGSSSVIIPSTTVVTKSEAKEIGRNVGALPYSRFSVPHNVSLPSHLIQGSHIATTVNTTASANNLSMNTRSHSVGVPYHPISAAYVFHDMGHPIGIHNFPHQLIRPPTTSVGSVPMFAIDSQRAVPVVSIAVSNKGISDVPHEAGRPEGLTIHSENSAFSYPNLYPNLQPATFPTTFSSSSISMESSVRPSILRKRPPDTATSFPVQPTEKERISSPVKSDGLTIASNMIISPPNLTSKEKVNDTKINHSILSITSDLNKDATIENSLTSEMQSAKVTSPPVLIPNAISNATNLGNNLPEASPKKKPRKQLIITTEDKYGSTAPINNACATDEDEEFLKANETMKDITPPKLNAVPTTSTTTQQKQLFPPPTSEVEVKQEVKDVQINGVVTSALDTKTSEAMKYYIFRRRPQVSILNEYKVNTKAAHNHFYRHSDVKVKEEKKSVSHDRMFGKSSIESMSGWRLHHLATQLDDMITLENDICKEVLECKESIPLPSVSSPGYQNSQKLSGEDRQLRLLHEIIQGNIQRCRYSIEQLDEAKQNMFKLLDQKPKVMEIVKKYKQKPRLKKKLNY